LRKNLCFAEISPLVGKILFNKETRDFEIRMGLFKKFALFLHAFFTI